MMVQTALQLLQYDTGFYNQPQSGVVAAGVSDSCCYFLHPGCYDVAPNHSMSTETLCTFNRAVLY